MSQKNWRQLLTPFVKKYLWCEFQLNTIGKGGKVLILLYSNLLMGKLAIKLDERLDFCNWQTQLN